MKIIKNYFFLVAISIYIAFFNNIIGSNLSIIKKTLIPVYISYKLFKSIYIFKNLSYAYNKNDTKPHGVFNITHLDTAQNHPVDLKKAFEDFKQILRNDFNSFKNKFF
jgi:hypothetical protein